MYTKTFISSACLDKEQIGYRFFSRYYHRIPVIIAADKCSSPVSITYEDVSSAEVVTASLFLLKSKSIDVKEMLQLLSQITNENKVIRRSGGGTVMFYIDRIPRLLQKKGLYATVLAKCNSAFVNGANVVFDPSLLALLTDNIGRFKVGLCSPSEGDLHERNFFTNGYIVDFEASGWNLVATDVATFIWHTLVVGNYFGPKYARWSTDEDKRSFSESPAQIKFGNKNISICLTKSRKKLVRDYLKFFLDVIEPDVSLLQDVCYAVAFRLLTVFDLSQMDDQDAIISFALANFFIDKSHNFYQKLSIIMK